MYIRKGPFGHFAVSELQSDKSNYDYVSEIINSKDNKHYLPVYQSVGINGPEFDFDFTGKISIEDYEPTGKDNKTKQLLLMDRRKSIGDLFLTMLSSLDYLLFPSNICLNPKYIYTSENGTDIYVCYRPVNTYDKLSISSLPFDKIEKLLDHPFIGEVLTDDEKQSVIYAIKNNNETGLKEISERIINTTPINPSNTKNALPDRLMYSLFLISGALLLAYFSLYIPTVLSVLGSMYYLFIHLSKSSSKNQKVQEDTIKKISDERTHILFDEDNTNSLDFKCVYLRSLHEINGSFINYGIYNSRSTIGSDRFLSDLFIAEDSIAPLHAIIELTEQGLFITHTSPEYHSYVENVELECDVKYEIKNGQILAIGKNEFEISIT